MKEYIYIIAFIAYIAYSFYSAAQKRKKKEMQQRPTYVPVPQPEPELQETSKPGRSVFEELFGEDFEEIRKTIDKQPSKEEPEPVRPFEYKPEVPVYYKQPTFEEINISSHSSIASLLTESEDPVSVSVVPVYQTPKHLDAFDLRKAIIFATILDRPYK